MRILNIHERSLPVAANKAGTLLDSLSSKADILWPLRSWPAMRLDRPLAVGAKGGHGPVRYFVEEYEPSKRVVFRFTGPTGFDGTHRFEVLDGSGEETILRHTLEMIATGPALITWPLFFHPTHDAVLEDAMACAEKSLDLTPTIVPWTRFVRLLRFLSSRGRSGPQKL